MVEGYVVIGNSCLHLNSLEIEKDGVLIFIKSSLQIKSDLVLSRNNGKIQIQTIKYGISQSWPIDYIIEDRIQGNKITFGLHWFQYKSNLIFSMKCYLGINDCLFCGQLMLLAFGQYPISCFLFPLVNYSGLSNVLCFESVFEFVFDFHCQFAAISLV